MGRQNDGHDHSLGEINAAQNGGMIDVFHAAAALAARRSRFGEMGRLRLEYQARPIVVFK
jgi:hypothetical protein